MFTDVEFIAGVKGEAVSYAYACAGGPALAPIVVKGITAPSCADEFTVAYEESVTRYIFVGDGTLDSVADPIWELKNKARSTVTGWSSTLTTTLQEGSRFLLSQNHFMKQVHNLSTKPVQMVMVASCYTSPKVTLSWSPIISNTKEDAVQILSQPGNSESVQLQLQGHAQLQIQTNFFGLDGAPLIPHPSKLSIMPEENTQVPLNILGDFVEKDLVTTI